MSTDSLGRIRVETGPKRVRAFLHGRAVVDTTRPLLVWERPHYPTYYLPVADVRADLRPTGETEHSPSRGEGRVHDVLLGDLHAPGAAVTFPDSPIEDLRDHVRLDWSSMSAWFEEDEQVHTHPRSPYTRIDILPTSRHVQVLLDGTVLADSTRAHVLFETGLPPRWYLPQVDVRMDLLGDSATVTRCPYKGTTRYLTAETGGRVADVAWIYPAPLPESVRIAGLVAFDDRQVTVLVDGQRV